MANKALFHGLVYNEAGVVAPITTVGDEPFYIVDDDGFARHVAAAKIDKQVLLALREQMEGNEDLIAEGAMKMMGKDDLFTKALIDVQLRNIDEHLEKLHKMGMPAGAQQWLSMLGFSIVVDHHGDVVQLNQPMIADDEGGL